MQETYSRVPNIISSKDLDYLSDMFNWNYGAYKTSLNAANSVSDEELSLMLQKASNVFHSNMTKVLNIINNGGNNE
ncbi:MAG: hypothetical protein E7174_04395 [Firmicutes bacterium]|nr:hypothetical protein [Bacillota bacterium]